MPAALAANDNHPPLVTLDEAARLTSLSRSMVNRYRADGKFPLAVRMGERRVAFVRNEIVAWIDERIAARSAA